MVFFVARFSLACAKTSLRAVRRGTPQKQLPDRPSTIAIEHRLTKPYPPWTTDVIDKCFLAGSELFSSRAWVTARRRAGREAQALPRSLHRRTSVAAPVRTRLGPRGFQPG